MEVAQADLEADHADLLAILTSESEDETQLSIALSSLLQKLQEIFNDLPELDADGLGKVTSEALPALERQLEEISRRHDDAKNGRQAVAREWAEGTNLEKANELIGDIKKGVGEKETERLASEEWLVKKKEVDQEMRGGLMGKIAPLFWRNFLSERKFRHVLFG